MKKVLMIAYYFPPAAGVGTFRITKFMKFLPSFGWEPAILTIKTPYYNNLDDTLISDIYKNIKVYRTDIARFPINDVGIKWLPILIKEFKKIINKEKIDVAYFTGGPFFQWRAAPILKKKYKIPYVVDFRDPWVVNPYKRKKLSFKKIIGNFLANRWEPIIIKNASRVLFATKPMEEIYSKVYLSYKQKFLTIENGYDPADYKDILPKKFSTFSLVYSGKFPHYRDPVPLFSALQELKDIIDFQFIHVGRVESLLKKLTISKNLQDRVIFTDLKLYREAISYSKGANILVLVTGESRTELTHKVFDYIACNKPIIAITGKDSAVAEVLSHFRNTFIIQNNLEAIKNTIITIYKAKLSNLEPKDNQALSKYHRKNLTEKLAKILNKIIS